MNDRERANLISDLRRILGFTVVGGVRWQNVMLAQRHAAEWQAITRPGQAAAPVRICQLCAHDLVDTQTCGSCGAQAPTLTLSSGSITERAERDEDRCVAIQAARDEQTLSELIPAFEAELVLANYHAAPTRDLADVAQQLAEVVARCIRTVDHTKLPQDAPEGCRSCGRLGRRRGIPGHYEPLSTQTRYAKKGLCSWCGRHSSSEGWPPIEAIEIRVHQGEHAAGRWLARNDKKRRGAA